MDEAEIVKVELLDLEVAVFANLSGGKDVLVVFANSLLGVELHANWMEL